MRADSCENDKEDCTAQFCAFDCLYTQVGDGTCDPACQFSGNCNYDGGDCPGECAPWCENSAVGNIVNCNPACNNEACNFDGGDCDRMPGGKDNFFAG